VTATSSKHFSDTKLILAAMAFAAFGAGLLLYPAQVRDGLLQSVGYCLGSLVPSLFPFMVLASYGVRSGAGDVLGKLLAPMTRHLFRLPETCGAVILLSFLGGYPAGARGVSLLLQEGRITKAQAGRMMTFCVAPGAAFVVTFLGCGLLGSVALGWLLFGAVTLSGLLLGILSSIGKPLPQERTFLPASSSTSPLVRSVGDASSATATMCGCILLFAGFTAILQGSGLFLQLASLLTSTGLFSLGEAAACLAFLIEVTGGTGTAAATGAGAGLYAFGLAFGGLCVHLQVFSFFPEFPLAKPKFFLGRLLHGLLSAGIFLLLKHLLPLPAQQVWAVSGAPLEYGITASTAAGGLSLLLMCLAFLLAVSKNRS
jgi:hypothetical protein